MLIQSLQYYLWPSVRPTKNIWFSTFQLHSDPELLYKKQKILERKNHSVTECGQLETNAHNLILVVKLKMCDPTFLPLRANMDLEACKDKYLSCPLPNLILPANIAQTYSHLRILQFPFFHC